MCKKTLLCDIKHKSYKILTTMYFKQKAIITISFKSTFYES